VVAVGPDGERVIPIAAFFTDSTFETTLRPNEVLTEIRVPAPNTNLRFSILL
jgi:carbon-monoxide dehydrogenase medium subunit